MTNKAYAMDLMKGIRHKQSELIKTKPQSRDLNVERYTQALKEYKAEYAELEKAKNEIISDYQNGVEFIQF